MGEREILILGPPLGKPIISSSEAKEEERGDSDLVAPHSKACVCFAIVFSLSPPPRVFPRKGIPLVRLFFAGCLPRVTPPSDRPTPVRKGAANERTDRASEVSRRRREGRSLIPGEERGRRDCNRIARREEEDGGEGRRKEEEEERSIYLSAKVSTRIQASTVYIVRRKARTSMQGTMRMEIRLVGSDSKLA